MPGTNFDVDDDWQLFKLNQQLEKLVTSGSILDREKIQKLIDQGADVNSTHRFGDKTPLHIAAWSDNFFIAELLIKNGADINAEDKFNGTPLHFAAWNNSLQVARLLISHGADIEAFTQPGPFTRQRPGENVISGVFPGFGFMGGFFHHVYPGSRPLHFAMHAKSQSVAALLVNRGADTGAKDAMDRTPLDIAIEDAPIHLIISKSGWRSPQAIKEAKKARVAQALKNEPDKASYQDNSADPQQKAQE